MKTIYALGLAGLVIASCKSPEPKQKTSIVAQQTAESVVKPIAGLGIAPRIFTVSATEASKIELPNGGSILFPENAFVDASGHPVKGKVDIAWKEFHSLTDIMLSGIPMKYDSLGQEYDFVSGGMFDISASAHNQPVELAQGKKATVNLASIDDTPCYNFYSLDEKTGDWDYKTTAKGTPVPHKKQDKAPGKKNTEAEASEIKDFILDAQVNTSAFPELKDQPVVGWRVLDKITPAQQRMLSGTLTESTLLAGDKPGDYVLTVAGAKAKHSFHVKPYLLSEAKKAMQKHEVKQVKEYAEILAFQDNVNAGKIVRSIEIPSFGIYNWDRMCVRTDLPYVFADFKLPNNTNLAMATVYFISPDENLVIKWSASYGNKLHFDPSKRNGIVAILPDNSIVSAGNEEFLRAARNPGGEHQFKMKESGMVVQSGQDIAKYLGALI